MSAHIWKSVLVTTKLTVPRLKAYWRAPPPSPSSSAIKYMDGNQTTISLCDTMSNHIDTILIILNWHFNFVTHPIWNTSGFNGFPNYFHIYIIKIVTLWAHQATSITILTAWLMNFELNMTVLNLSTIKYYKRLSLF